MSVTHLWGKVILIMANDYNNLPPEYRPISMWGYFGYEILFSIPIVGFILLLVFSFGGTKNVSQRCCILLRFPLLIGKISLEILIPCFIVKARHPYLALLRLMVTGSSTFSISPGSAMYSLSSAHFDAASSIARSTLHAFASIKSLHKKSAVSSAEFGLWKR